MASTTSDLVTLRGGCTVPLPALQLLWQLEERDLIIRLDDGGGLLIGPRGRVTDEERASIRQYRNELVTLVKYCEAIQ